METCWLPEAVIRILKSLTRESQRSLEVLLTVKRVNRLIPFLIISFYCCCYLYPSHSILDWIRCIRWSPSGDMIASASSDTTVKLLDFNTGKTIHTGETSEKGNLLHLTSHYPWFMIRKCFLSLLHMSGINWREEGNDKCPQKAN